MAFFARLQLLLLVAFISLAAADCTLQPLTAQLVDNHVKQPSGLTFSERTLSLYMICDTSNCNYIYEFDQFGTYSRKLKFSKSHKDVEAVASYDADGLLYIGEESLRKVTAFHMPSTSGDDDEDLEEAFTFTLTKPDGAGSNNGLEGMTVAEDTGDFYCTNEKSPRQIIHLTQEGDDLDVFSPEYCSDLSGLAFDRDGRVLWVLSDISERVFATDIDTGEVLDFWDLEFQNPEGIAINNVHDPPLLYITTDPSAPTGPGYVAALFVFEKPAIGTGLSFNDDCSFEDNCQGCSEVFAAAGQGTSSPASRNSVSGGSPGGSQSSAACRYEPQLCLLFLSLAFLACLY